MIYTTLQMPASPPAYEDADDVFATPVEQFDIDEDVVYERLKRDLFLQRAAFATKRAAFALRDRVGAPLVRCCDPVVEGFRFFQTKYDQAILKVGNPLVVKRLLYVVFVVAVMYGISENESTDGVNGASGGAFSTGKFYDVQMLGDTLRRYIDASTLKDNMEYVALMPHVAGTMGDLTLARYVESYFRNNGVQLVDVHVLDAFLNYPTPSLYVRWENGTDAATLHDGDTAMQNLAFCPNLPSSNGEIFAPYVYVNHGDPEDFALLDAAHVSVEGAIVVMRYGGRLPVPNKVYAISRLGAKAVVFVSDKSTWGGDHDDVITCANVALTRVCPGDVLTPGWMDAGGLSSMSWEQSLVTAKIPAIPVSWRDGSQLIQKLSSGVDFGDGMFSGTATEKLRLRVVHEERTTHLVWNVVGVIRGREQGDKGVIFGAARDSLAYGAAGAASSTAALLELVKVFTSLQRRFDWYPLRLIYFVLFDASEYNMAGAGEWAEEHKLLAQDGYVYIDVADVASGDTLTVLSNPLLLAVIRDELRNVVIPSGKKDGSRTLYDLYKQQHGSDSFSNNMVADRNYLPFINRLGMAALDIGFRGKAVPSGSPADSFANYEKEMGTSVASHMQMVELLARVGLRLAEDPMLPYDVLTYADELTRYLHDLDTYVAKKIADFSSSASMDYSNLGTAIKKFRERFAEMDSFRTHWKDFIKSTSSLEPALLASSRKGANLNMMEFSRVFMRLPLLTVRMGYLNMVFGPAYEAPPYDDGAHEWNTFPGVRDMAAMGRFEEAQKEIDRLADLMTSAADFGLVP